MTLALGRAVARRGARHVRQMGQHVEQVLPLQLRQTCRCEGGGAVVAHRRARRSAARPATLGRRLGGRRGHRQLVRVEQQRVVEQRVVRRVLHGPGAGRQPHAAQQLRLESRRCRRRRHLLAEQLRRIGEFREVESGRSGRRGRPLLFPFVPLAPLAPLALPVLPDLPLALALSIPLLPRLDALLHAQADARVAQEAAGAAQALRERDDLRGRGERLVHFRVDVGRLRGRRRVERQGRTDAAALRYLLLDLLFLLQSPHERRLQPVRVLRL